MNRHLLAIVATAALVLGLLAPTAPAQALAGGWNDGKNDQDTIIGCVTGGASTGVSANVGWRSPSGQVPRVGEKFYLRGYVGLVSLPCNGTVSVLPEIMVPRGVEFVDEDVRWDLTTAGDAQQLGTGDLAFGQGANGGILMGHADDTPFTLRQGDVLEFQFPVRATRVLKGPATQQPECRSRRNGTAPCPISQAGDHLQVAFTVGGHGGNKRYVTPYVGLFAGGSGPQPTTKAASKTAASFAVSKLKLGKAVVRVTSSRPVSGRVVIADRGKVIGRATLGRSGGATVRLPRLSKGVHKLVARYLGSASVKPSASATRTVRLR